MISLGLVLRPATTLRPPRVPNALLDENGGVLLDEGANPLIGAF